MDRSMKKTRIDAWKKRFKETIGRDHFSSIEGFVVAGSIFDLINELENKGEQKRKAKLEEHMKHHYNVYVYRLLRIPSHSAEKKRFIT